MHGLLEPSAFANESRAPGLCHQSMLNDSWSIQNKEGNSSVVPRPHWARLASSDPPAYAPLTPPIVFVGRRLSPATLR